jgi:hypothetical protein
MSQGRDLFSANKANKAIYLDNEFRQLLQGASTIFEYCRHQKHLTDALAEKDSAVSDRALILNTLCGLGPRFASAATVISMTEPLPTFLQARGMLLMEEMQQANAASNAASTALVAQACPPPPWCTSTGCRGDTFTSGKKPQYKPKNKNGKNNGGYSTTSSAPRPALPAPVGPWICYSPGAGQWRAPSGQGILGPRPQAYHTTSAPVYQSSS